MTLQTTERYPHPNVIVAERFGENAEEFCTKCGKRKDDALTHLPAELGGGCLNLDDPTCPMCGAMPNECEPWCELARLDR